MNMWIKTFSLTTMVLALISISLAIKPSKISNHVLDEANSFSIPSTLTCSNLVDYMDECFEDFVDSGLVPFKGGKSCSQRIPYCFKKRMELGAIKMDASLARCLDNFKYGSECNTTSLYEKCCRLPFQESGGCPPINYGTCEFTTCNPFGVQCNSAFRCVAPIGFACDTDSDCIQGLYCTNCVCSVTQPIGPPSTAPVTPPVAPPVVTPIAPPVPPSVPDVNCTNNAQISVILQQCQIDCGSGCSICGQVWSYCYESGRLTSNYTIDTCMTINLDNIPTSLGFCPFLTTLDGCCGVIPTPVSPPITPPVAPPIPTPISPPVAPPVPVVNCTDNNVQSVILEQCQIDCGLDCTICGQVWTFCVENGFISANYTISACLTIELDSISTGLGFCPFNATLTSCCNNVLPPVTPPVVAPVSPPVVPPVSPPVTPVPTFDCLDNTLILSLLESCQIACGAGCQYCGDVFSYCEENGIFTSNYTLDTCMTVSLDYSLVSSGCNYNASLNTCCDIPQPPFTPDVDCTNNNNITQVLMECETACGSACFSCGDVFSYCEINGYFKVNQTLDTCMTVTLDYLPIAGGCPYNASLTSCCGLPGPAPETCVNNTAVEEKLIACQTECGTECPFCGDVFSYCVFNGNISTNFTVNACATINLDYISTGLGTCPFASTLTSCCSSLVPPIAPPVVPPVAPPVTPPLVVDCLDNLAVTAVLDTCQTLCGAGCDYCGQVFSYCVENGFISANYTQLACNVIYLDFVPTNVGACPFNDTLTFCCNEPEPPVPVVPVSPPTTPLPVPLVDCTNNPSIVTILDACQTLCGANCDFCGQVYTFCSDSNLISGNFTIDACMVINLDFIPTNLGACPFNATLTSCCAQLEPPVPALTKSKSNGGKLIKEKKHDWDEAKCSLSRYAEAHYCMMAYQDLSCADRLKKCKDYVIKSVESDESKQCLMNKVSQSKDLDTCHFDRAINSCCT